MFQRYEQHLYFPSVISQTSLKVWWDDRVVCRVGFDGRVVGMSCRVYRVGRRVVSGGTVGRAAAPVRKWRAGRRRRTRLACAPDRVADD